MAHQSSLFRSNDSTRTNFGPSYGSAHMQNMNGRYEEQVRGPAVNQNHGPGYHGQQSQAVRTMNSNGGNSSRFNPSNNVQTGSIMGTNPTHFKPGPSSVPNLAPSQNKPVRHANQVSALAQGGLANDLIQQSQAVRTMNSNGGNSSRFNPSNNVQTGSIMGTNPTHFKPGPSSVPNLAPSQNKPVRHANQVSALAQGGLANETFININPRGHINYQQPAPSGNLYFPNSTHSVQGQMNPSGPNLQNCKPVRNAKQPSQLERCMTKAKELGFGINEDVVHLGELFREKENQEIFLSFTGARQSSWLVRGIADQMKKKAAYN